jgi:beta-N-acetylhexosaminidase
MAQLGVNMNLAPVADLHTRSDMLNRYRVMHRRTFGDDPNRVGVQVAAYVDGLRDSGVIGVIKHFPGHGGAADSHANLPLIDIDSETALATALHTFNVAVENGVQAVMVGHLYYSELEPETDLPASLSPTLMGILRDDFGFEGIIMTDAMDMGAMMNNFYVPDAALQFVQAGGDMFVAGPYMTWDMQREAIQRIIDAVNNDELSEDRIDESVRRILRVKDSYGLLDWEPIEAPMIDKDASQQALIDTYMDAATVVKDDNTLLPLSADDSVVIIYPAIYQQINETCRSFAPDVEFYGYNLPPADWEYGNVARLGRTYDKVVIFTEDAFIEPRQEDLLRTLPPEKTILVTLGIPYDYELMPEVSTFMAMYHSITASRIAACNVLFGDHPATGRLPIAVGEFPTGSGMDVR